MRDFKRMQTDPPEGVNGAPLDNDIMQWHAVIFGCAPAATSFCHPYRLTLMHVPPCRPEDTAWEDGTFKLTLEFTEEYPNKAPTVKFLTKSRPPHRAACTIRAHTAHRPSRACVPCAVFHPNIYADGSICLDILQNQWSPIYDISAILTSIQSLLCDPNPSSPANSEAARLYQENRREYERKVKEIVEQSWQADDE